MEETRTAMETKPQQEMDKRSSPLRVVILSGLSGFTAPLVFVLVLVMRRGQRRARSSFRRANKRFQHEVARWT